MKVKRLESGKFRPWWVVGAAVGGLLVFIAMAGIAGLALNERVSAINDSARYDVELEDMGDDLRVAVLDVRHFHRNIAFAGDSRNGTAEFEAAYATLQTEIDELEELGVRDNDAPQPEELRAMAGEYYEGFRPVLELDNESPEFIEASDRGLARLDRMEETTRQIDALSEELASDALNSVEQATTSARILLLAVLGGLTMVGAALAYTAVKTAAELRRLYASERESAGKLAEASQAKTEFLADVSHELRTPLTILHSNAEVGQRVDQDPAYYRELLARISGESGRMRRMVEDLLLLARSDSASLPLETEALDAELFLVEVAERADALAKQRGATLKARLGGEGQLLVDLARMEQAVLVLVDNAAKYGAPGGEITLSSDAAGGRLAIEVSDRGPGIPEEHRDRVFERFYRVDKARSRKQGGSGLGLPIAKTIVEAHGGRIEARERDGGGTRMRITLPLRPERGAEEIREKQAST